MSLSVDFSGLSFLHSTPVQVRYSDVDRMNHVTNSVLVAYCDVGRMAYFKEVLQEDIGPSSTSLIIASMTVDFLQPVFLFDSMMAQSKVIEIGNKSLTMAQQLVHAETGTVKTRAITVLCGYHYGEARTIVIPRPWREKIECYEGKVRYKQVTS